MLPVLIAVTLAVALGAAALLSLRALRRLPASDAASASARHERAVAALRRVTAESQGRTAALNRDLEQLRRTGARHDR